MDSSKNTGASTLKNTEARTLENTGDSLHHYSEKEKSLIHKLVLLLGKHDISNLDIILGWFQKSHTNLTKQMLREIINSLPSLFSSGKNDEVVVQPLSMKFVETCLQVCEDPQHIPEQHNLDSNIAENEAFYGYIADRQIMISNLRVHSTNQNGFVVNPTGKRLYHVKNDHTQLLQEDGELKIRLYFRSFFHVVSKCENSMVDDTVFEKIIDYLKASDGASTFNSIFLNISHLYPKITQMFIQGMIYRNTNLFTVKEEVIETVIQSTEEGNQIQESVNNSGIDINKPKDWSSKISPQNLYVAIVEHLESSSCVDSIDNIYRSVLQTFPRLKKSKFQEMISCNPHVFKKSNMVYLNSHSLTKPALQGLSEQSMTLPQCKTIPEIDNAVSLNQTECLESNSYDESLIVNLESDLSTEIITVPAELNLIPNIAKEVVNQVVEYLQAKNGRDVLGSIWMYLREFHPNLSQDQLHELIQNHHELFSSRCNDAVSLQFKVEHISKFIFRACEKIIDQGSQSLEKLVACKNSLDYLPVSQIVRILNISPLFTINLHGDYDISNSSEVAEQLLNLAYNIKLVNDNESIHPVQGYSSQVKVWHNSIYILDVEAYFLSAESKEWLHFGKNKRFRVKAPDLLPFGIGIPVVLNLRLALSQSRRRSLRADILSVQKGEETIDTTKYNTNWRDLILGNQHP